METEDTRASLQQISETEQSQETIYEKFLHNLLAILIVLFHILQLLVGIVIFVGQRLGDEIIATEHMFLLMSSLYSFMCQFFFFTLCDITLLKFEVKNKRSGKVISGLTTLLLYSIFTYFSSKIRDTFTHSIGRYHRHGTMRAHILRLTKIMLEFAKAAIVIMCLREQGLQYHFDPCYSSATFVYYICTEKLFVDAFIFAAKLFALDIFDGLEHLYIPIILHTISIGLTIVVLSILLSMQRYTIYACLSSYFTLYLPIKNVVWNYLTPLLLERKTFASFKVANEKELANCDDVCAVCLERMSKARITPCRHFFHPQCLKRCLQSSMQCPLCKSDFVDAIESPYGNYGVYFNRRRRHMI